MASGHANRTNRPNTWPHRPSLRREESPCPIRSRPHMAQSVSAAVSELWLLPEVKRPTLLRCGNGEK
jgi:hypothetical protein